MNEFSFVQELPPPPLRALPGATLSPGHLPTPARWANGMLAEYKLLRMRECNFPEGVTDTPDLAAAFWNRYVKTANWYDSEKETFIVMFLNTRRYVTGFNMVSIGTLDTILVHPREVFRVAITAGASAVILMHNHPSGDPTPSEADIKVTRDLIRAGQLLKIDVLDHLVIGELSGTRIKQYSSLRELGYFYS